MTQDEIIEMARQADIKYRTNVFYSQFCDGVYEDDLKTFAKLVAAKAIAELESQEPFVLKAHQWEVAKKGTKNLIQVGTLNLGGIEENADGAEFNESDIDRLEDVIEALQEKLVIGRDNIKLPLLAYAENLQVDTPSQRTWVGLASEDRLTAKYMQDAPDGIQAVIDYIEAKLKEKNCL